MTAPELSHAFINVREQLQKMADAAGEISSKGPIREKLLKIRSDLHQLFMEYERGPDAGGKEPK